MTEIVKESKANCRPWCQISDHAEGTGSDLPCTAVSGKLELHVPYDTFAQTPENESLYTMSEGGGSTVGVIVTSDDERVPHVELWAADGDLMKMMPAEAICLARELEKAARTAMDGYLPSRRRSFRSGK